MSKSARNLGLKSMVKSRCSKNAPKKVCAKQVFYRHQSASTNIIKKWCNLPSELHISVTPPIIDPNVPPKKQIFISGPLHTWPLLSHLSWSLSVVAWLQESLIDQQLEKCVPWTKQIIHVSQNDRPSKSCSGVLQNPACVLTKMAGHWALILRPTSEKAQMWRLL